jgi:uncharacterized Zn-binding protein involved in type VI secretion
MKVKSENYPGKGKKIFIYIIFLINSCYCSIAETVFEVANAGDWKSTATWSGGIVAPYTNFGDDVLIRSQGADKNVDLNDNITISDNYQYSFMLNSGVLSIYGDVTISNGNFALTTQGSGKIKIYGNLNILTSGNVSITCSQLIEVFGNVNIGGGGTVNINGGPFIVHGNYTSSGAINITPDAVFAVQGSFEGFLKSYNDDGNLYVGSGDYNLLPPIPEQAVCTPAYSGPNTSSDCPVGDFIDLANRCPDIYSTYFGNNSLSCYDVYGINQCTTGLVVLKHSTSGIQYQLYRYGVYTNTFQNGTGDSLVFTVTTEGNYMIKAVNGSIWRYMNGVAVITLNTMPVLSVGDTSRCGAGEITIDASVFPTNASVYWYSQSSGGTLLHQGLSYTAYYETSTPLYVEAHLNGCITPRKVSNANVFPIPAVNPITAH